MNLPMLSPAERAARALEKRTTILQFLVSENYSDISTVAQLLGVNADTAGRTLKQMARDGLLAREEIAVGLKSKVVVYGLLPGGIAEAGADPSTTPEFERGRAKATNLPHTIGTQQIRLALQKQGWSDWVAGRVLYGKGLPKVPDALGTDATGKRVAIEFERNFKSRKRCEEVLAGHLVAISKQHWHRVLFVCADRCRADSTARHYLNFETVRTSAGEARVTEQHKSRFEFVNFSEIVR